MQLTQEDLIRKDAINQLICHFELDFSVLNKNHDINALEYFADELQALLPMVEDGLLQMDANKIKVFDGGRLLIRRICMVFDSYLKNSTQIRYSKVI